MSGLRDHLGQLTHLTDGKSKCRPGRQCGQGHHGGTGMGNAPPPPLLGPATPSLLNIRWRMKGGGVPYQAVPLTGSQTRESRLGRCPRTQAIQKSTFSSSGARLEFLSLFPSKPTIFPNEEIIGQEPPLESWRLSRREPEKQPAYLQL